MTLSAPWTMRGLRWRMHRYSGVSIETGRRKGAAHSVALGRVPMRVTLLGAPAGHREGLGRDGTPRSSDLEANDRYGQPGLRPTGHGLDGGSQACRAEMWRGKDRSGWIAPLMVVGHPPRGACRSVPRASPFVDQSGPSGARRPREAGAVADGSWTANARGGLPSRATMRESTPPLLRAPHHV